jgi:DNA repair protein RecO (recombination protein O)
MPLVSTPAVVLSAIQYGETSKIVRLATRDHGVQSAIAKGALRPRSRFGAALQVLSAGQAHLILSERRDLHTLTAFDVGRVPVQLTQDLDRYGVAAALAEVMGHFAPAEPHATSFDLLQRSLTLLESAPHEALGVLGLRLLWRLVSVLGFAPSLGTCVRDGSPVSGDGPLPFSSDEGGALCTRCASGTSVTRLTAKDRADLAALVSAEADLPALDARHTAAHRRLLARYIRYHLGEGATLPALEFWQSRAWSRP